MTTEQTQELLELLDRIATSLNKIAVALYSVRDHAPDWEAGRKPFKETVPLAKVIDQGVQR
jgi:hypothetical protein